MRTTMTLLLTACSIIAFTAVGCGQAIEDETESTMEGRALEVVGAPLLPGAATLGPWGGYSNGNIPLGALTQVSYPGLQLDVFPGSLSGLYLKPDAASAMLSLLREYNRQTGGYLHPNEGYRTYAGQVYWKDYWTRQGKPGNAATPGTSNHGWAQAVDFNLNSAESSWLGSNASRYGYRRSSTESWHFDYVGGGAGGTSSCGSLSTTATESDGIPGPNYWKLFQCFAAKRGGYAGPIDGVPGYYTYSGFQRAARSFGYTGPDDGSFSATGYSNVGLALQKVAASYGYTGAQDGIPGPNTYKRSAAYFNYLWLNHGLD